MKPRIFIGSSKESLDIAYTIQDSLENDSTPTVWNQGIFNLSNTALDDLIKALNDFDFAVFVFKPEDILVMRESQKKTVRDNVLFEMGLFIGKLGKERVYFVQPKFSDNTHLASDLLGINYGEYDNTREDGNQKAALGPFCQQVRLNLKEFLVENLLDFANESKEAKKLALSKPAFWEFLLASELLESKMEEINISYEELDKGLVFQKVIRMSETDALPWAGTAMQDVLKIVSIFKKTFEVELFSAFGPPGKPGSVQEIKRTTDLLISLCRNLLNWEYELVALETDSKEMSQIFTLMRGWTFDLINQVNILAKQLKDTPTMALTNPSSPIRISLTFSEPKNMDKINNLIAVMQKKYGI